MKRPYNCIRIATITNMMTYQKVRAKLLHQGFIEHPVKKDFYKAVFVGYIGFIGTDYTGGITCSPQEFLSGKVKIPQVSASVLWKESDSEHIM